MLLYSILNLTIRQSDCVFGRRFTDGCSSLTNCLLRYYHGGDIFRVCGGGREASMMCNMYSDREKNLFLFLPDGMTDMEIMTLCSVVAPDDDTDTHEGKPI